jgi:hypothetical protein
MTYKKHTKCGFICTLKRILRGRHWTIMTKPLSWHVQAAKYTGVTIHKGGAY